MADGIMAYRDDAVYVIVCRHPAAENKPHKLDEAWLGSDKEHGAAVCGEARQFSQQNPGCQLTVWRWTLSAGLRCVAEYEDGIQSEYGVMLQQTAWSWLLGPILYAIAEHVEQAASIMRQEADQLTPHEQIAE